MKDPDTVARMDTSRLQFEIGREDDGRWYAIVPELPGVMQYGASKEEAVRRTTVLALNVLAEMVEHGEDLPESVRLFLAA